MAAVKSSHLPLTRAPLLAFTQRDFAADATAGWQFSHTAFCFSMPLSVLSSIFSIFHLLIAASHPSTQAPPDRQVQLCHPLKTAKTPQDKRERDTEKEGGGGFLQGGEGQQAQLSFFCLQVHVAKKNKKKPSESWTSTTETSVVKPSQGADAHVPVTYASPRRGRMGG